MKSALLVICSALPTVVAGSGQAPAQPQPPAEQPSQPQIYRRGRGGLSRIWKREEFLRQVPGARGCRSGPPRRMVVEPRISRCSAAGATACSDATRSAAVSPEVRSLRHRTQ